ncbi:septal ring lytic transglycosylase RlpA family protein [Burkholderia sp. Ac-20379]|uniref:septal ring lytic transglycosylase RlpA family protein n=1 Tax=Burkholderia sp. Ac-20379 TaxID=2703900 RepID=UPI00197D8E67|nr:septal ring lytic transglycosylase RlpA family protein [Burkholderia sp. Ac-20379]MBN3723482.1 septal ring lytic transglycosylase RlpA family protein [Burkholderia sp. Ac-20379]
MKFRLPRQLGSVAMVVALTGCAMPPNADQASNNSNPKDALRTASAGAADDDSKQANFDSALATLPATDTDDAKRASLADAKPIDAADVSDFRQTGRASWYGRAFHGKRTANGERFDMNELTAAHRTLPLSSYVKVINQSNGKSVIVKINDRGPFARGRVLDLSYAAAKVIGVVKAGTARVKIVGLSPEQARIARDETVASNTNSH